MPNLDDADLKGFHLGTCYSNADSEPAGDGCSPDCPRRLHAEVRDLRANEAVRDSSVDAILDLITKFSLAKTAISLHRERTRRAGLDRGDAHQSINERLWAVLAQLD